jgi:hypothetical protein
MDVSSSGAESESEEETDTNRLDSGDFDYPAGREGADDEGASRKKKLPSFKKSKRGRVEGKPVQ